MSSYGEIVKGCNDAKVAILDAADAPGANVDILGIKSISVDTESDSDQQTGDDSVLATTQEAKSLAVSLTAAAANAAAFAAFTGATVATSGTTPNRIITYKEPSQPVSRYVQLTAQGTGRDTGGSAFRMLVYKAGIESGPTYEMSDGNWMEPSINLRGVDKAGFLFIASNYETSVAIT
jgi:hypothetical protein